MTFSRVRRDGITGVLAAVVAALDLTLEVLGIKVGSAVRTGSAASCEELGVLIGARVAAPIIDAEFVGTTPIDIACTCEPTYC
jgi:hypothetical protein